MRQYVAQCSGGNLDWSLSWNALAGWQGASGVIYIRGCDDITKRDVSGWRGNTGEGMRKKMMLESGKDRALGHTCGYCCGGWGWWDNFNKGLAICKIGANPRDDRAGQTKGMLKSVKKCESLVSNAADMSRAVKIAILPVNGLHDNISEFEHSGLSGVKFAIGRLQRAETGRYGNVRK